MIFTTSFLVCIRGENGKRIMIDDANVSSELFQIFMFEEVLEGVQDIDNKTSLVNVPNIEDTLAHNSNRFEDPVCLIRPWIIK